MKHDFNLFKRRVGVWLGIWVGGLILGALVLAIGAVVDSVPLLRIGLGCFGLAMLAEAVVRALLYRAAAKVRAYSWVFLGLRVVAVILLLYFATGIRL